jgi:hypothetical protein
MAVSSRETGGLADAGIGAKHLLLTPSLVINGDRFLSGVETISSTGSFVVKLDASSGQFPS